MNRGQIKWRRRNRYVLSEKKKSSLMRTSPFSFKYILRSGNLVAISRRYLCLCSNPTENKHKRYGYTIETKTPCGEAATYPRASIVFLLKRVCFAVSRVLVQGLLIFSDCWDLQCVAPKFVLWEKDESQHQGSDSFAFLPRAASTLCGDRQC